MKLIGFLTLLLSFSTFANSNDLAKCDVQVSIGDKKVEKTFSIQNDSIFAGELEGVYASQVTVKLEDINVKLLLFVFSENGEKLSIDLRTVKGRNSSVHSWTSGYGKLRTFVKTGKNKSLDITCKSLL